MWRRPPFGWHRRAGHRQGCLLVAVVSAGRQLGPWWPPWEVMRGSGMGMPQSWAMVDAALWAFTEKAALMEAPAHGTSAWRSTCVFVTTS